MCTRRIPDLAFPAAALILGLVFCTMAAANGQTEGVIRHFSSDEVQDFQLSAGNAIVPGERIGIFNFNMTLQDFRLLAGTPDGVYDRTNRAFAYLAEGETYHLFKSHGLAFVFRENRVMRMIALSPQYRVAIPGGPGNGDSIGIGDTEDRLRQSFNMVTALSTETDQYREYKFPDSGISFLVLKNDRTIWEIRVFKPAK